MSILLKQHDCYRRGNGGMLRKNLTMYTTVFTTGWATVKSFSFISNLCSIATKPFLLIYTKRYLLGLYIIWLQDQNSPGYRFPPRAEFCSSVVGSVEGLLCLPLSLCSRVTRSLLREVLQTFQ